MTEGRERVVVLLPGPVVRAQALREPGGRAAIADASVLGWPSGMVPFIWTRRGEILAGAGVTSALLRAAPACEIAARAAGGLVLARGKVAGLTDAAGTGLQRARATELRQFGLMLEAANAILPTAWVRCGCGSGFFSGCWAEFRPDWVDAVAWLCDQAPAVRA